ncbi:MAG: helix-turn-helix domain-containing protein [Bacteroidales bacterium]|nr:AraC family transcriptional regulator [Bacteroidales bacterium]MDD6773640.1 helix-turn-helix domain-containing protein [Bacteroidales bacterium]MDO4213664.1 helix-turn-helix domain-containing protein [Bacteroidales bacterium]
MMKKLFGFFRRNSSAKKRARREQQREQELLEKIRYRLEIEKDYLDVDFSEEILARNVATNITSLSRVINKRFGMNFRRLINGYRIEYAVSLMTKDPKMKLYSVSYESGFRSPETFKMAFLTIKGECPSDFLKRQRLKCPSNCVEEEQ